MKFQSAITFFRWFNYLRVFDTSLWPNKEIYVRLLISVFLVSYLMLKVPGHPFQFSLLKNNADTFMETVFPFIVSALPLVISIFSYNKHVYSMGLYFKSFLLIPNLLFVVIIIYTCKNRRDEAD